MNVVILVVGCKVFKIASLQHKKLYWIFFKSYLKKKLLSNMDIHTCDSEPEYIDALLLALKLNFLKFLHCLHCTYITISGIMKPSLKSKVQF